MIRMAVSRKPSRSLRWGANLAVVGGILGVVLGAVGAVTFIPYRQLDALSLGLAATLTLISTAGALLSGFESFEALRLRSAQPWSLPATLFGTVACAGTVAVMSSVWQPAAYFLGVVIFGYFLVWVLLLAGIGSYRQLRSTRALGTGQVS